MSEPTPLRASDGDRPDIQPGPYPAAVHPGAATGEIARDLDGKGWLEGVTNFVPQAIKEGFVAATNAVRGPTMILGQELQPIGSFTDPEYASVGLIEQRARERFDVLSAVARFDATTRPIIDGRTIGFCKLLVERDTASILGCHVVGERAVDITQVAAMAMVAKISVRDLARVPFAFPTYGGVLGRAAASAAHALEGSWRSAEELGMPAGA